MWERGCSVFHGELPAAKPGLCALGLVLRTFLCLFSEKERSLCLYPLAGSGGGEIFQQRGRWGPEKEAR